MSEYTLFPADWNEQRDTYDPAKFSLFKADVRLQGYIMGKSRCGCYAVAVNPGDATFADRLIDFIRYENAHGRRVLIFSPDFSVEEILQHHVPIEGWRSTDAPYAVHSTTLEAYKCIRRDGCLKSAARLRREGTAQNAIGFLPLGEPEDYLEHVMFAPVDGWGSGSEMVVNSRLRGQACFDPQASYTPQARMYFDARRMIEGGLTVRDGAHFLKVHDALPLEGYLLLSVFAEDVALPLGDAYWTPTNFTKQANEYFTQKMRTRERGSI